MISIILIDAPETFCSIVLTAQVSSAHKDDTKLLIIDGPFFVYNPVQGRTLHWGGEHLNTCNHLWNLNSSGDT